MPSMKTALRGDVDLTLFVIRMVKQLTIDNKNSFRKVRIGGLTLDQKLQQVIKSRRLQKIK